ncbi:Alpha/Beta hydrolase protein [Trametes elegans]|nr:Alpha/Beta hydrolase protein [Trametes elegans]
MAYNHFSAPDPELEPILASFAPSPEAFPEDIHAARHYFNTVYLEISRSFLRPNLPPVTAYVTEDHELAVEGGEVTVRTYRPVARDEVTFPVFFWMYGGGFVFGHLEMDDYHLKILCVDLQIAIVAVQYRLAPEHPFPTGLNDSYTALKWTVANASYIRADFAKGFIVGGQSAGGNLAAVLVQRAQHDRAFVQNPLTGQLLQIPVLLHPDATLEQYKDKLTSYVQNGDAPMLAARHMRDYFGKYRGSPFDPELSPLLRPSLEGLPPVYMQVCGLDPLRDEGLVYAERLKEAGVPTKLDVYPGAPHGFHLSLPKTQLAQKVYRDYRAGLWWLLSGGRAADA